MKTLLIIGGGIEQVPAYKAAKKRGLTVVGTDRNIDAPGLKLADNVIQASTRDANETVEKVERFSKIHKIDGVMTIANDVPYTVACVARILKLPSISVESAEKFRDKSLMKEAFGNSNIACPPFWNITNVEDIKNVLCEDSDVKYVLKPVDGRGAGGVLLIDQNTDLSWAFNESLEYSDSGRLILEKYTEGIQLSTESFIHKGVCYTASISERNYDRLDQFKPNIIEDGGTIPAQLPEKILNQIDNLILGGAKALGVEQGIIKGDIVINTNGSPEIIELAARISGGWFASHQILSASGIDLINVVISYSLNEIIEKSELLPKYSRGSAIRFWFPEPGIIKNINGESKLKQIPGLVKYGFYRETGDIQPEIKKHSDRFGYVITEGENRDEAIHRAELAISSVNFEIEKT